MANKKFTVRIPEQFIDFDFDWLSDDSLEYNLTLEALVDKAYDQLFSNEVKIELYDEHGLQVPLPEGDAPLDSEELGAPVFVKGPGNVG